MPEFPSTTDKADNCRDGYSKDIFAVKEKKNMTSPQIKKNNNTAFPGYAEFQIHDG